MRKNEGTIHEQQTMKRDTARFGIKKLMLMTLLHNDPNILH